MTQSIFIQAFYYLYNLFLYLKWGFARHIFSISSAPSSAPTPVIKNETQQYLLDKTAYFDIHKTSMIYPQQVDSFFYDKTQYTSIMKDTNNPFEKQWKTRILFEYTPRGNIIMMYDIYKMGFLYYSDQQSIPYDILNGAAMKYVILFKCLDFFIDEKYHKSPFLELYETEDMKETKTQQKINQQNARIKNTIQMVSKPVAPVVPTIAVIPETIKNRFLYQGKTANFPFCQTPSKKITKKIKSHDYPSNHSEHCELFEKDVKCVSYKDFKTKYSSILPTLHPFANLSVNPPSVSSKL